MIITPVKIGLNDGPKSRLLLRMEQESKGVSPADSVSLNERRLASFQLIRLGLLKHSDKLMKRHRVGSESTPETPPRDKNTSILVEDANWLHRTFRKSADGVALCGSNSG